MIYIVKTVIY